MSRWLRGAAGVVALAGALSVSVVFGIALLAAAGLAAAGWLLEDVDG